MLKLVIVLPIALLFSMLSQNTSTAVNTPVADTANLTNPVTPTPESQARAKQQYAMDCQMCHGEKGNGKGELVPDMKLKMKNFTDPETLKQKSDGELFGVIKNGIAAEKMPAEGDRAKDEELWNLVILLRSFSQK